MTGRGRSGGPLERETCADVIVPMLKSVGWADTQIVEQYKAAGPSVLGRGAPRDLGRGYVDYVLEIVPGLPVAVLEAKRAYREASDGLQQAVRYGQQLDVPLAYASNGSAHIERDLGSGRERVVESVPTPHEVWARYCEVHELSTEQATALRQPFNRNRRDAAGQVLTPRYYQSVAIHRVLKGIVAGRRRQLLLMATGTGKTFTAMQLIAKLRAYEDLVHPERSYRVLYLADRDALVKQPMNKDFDPAFGRDALERVRSGSRMGRELFFATYQAFAGGDNDVQALFTAYEPDFFDLVVVDECHRGAAAQTSSWRRVLEHFSSAVQLGLTATPKRDANVDTYDYFGNPVYEYSLRQGIEDGFLAPYRVRRVVLSPDAEGWQPEPGQRDRLGRDIPEGVYGTRDFERVVSLLARTQLAARHLSGILRKSVQKPRAIVFCVDVDHAEQMRAALVAENPDLAADDPEWVVRIVGIEGERTRLLEAFTDPESSSPVVATTSRLLSTGVDIEDLRYVVLFRPIGSQVEFKQIIGRGTRLYPEDDKWSFEIVDYVGASQHFEDPEFDGFPSHISVETVDGDGDVVQVDEPAGADSGDAPAADSLPVVHDPEPPFEPGGSSDVEEDGGPVGGRRKLYVDDGAFQLLAESRQVPDRSTGRLRLTEYGEYVAGQIRLLYVSRDDLARRWAERPGRQDVIEELAAHGVDVEVLLEDRDTDLVDPFDVLVSVAWNTPPLTRAERARRAREGHRTELEHLTQKARAVLTALLDRYVEHGVEDITSQEALRLPPIADLGSIGELAAAFGGPAEYHQQVAHLQRWLYSA